ncbi:MAG: hypothetical protein V4543_14335 [Bacteroidota bacterium]
MTATLQSCSSQDDVIEDVVEKHNFTDFSKLKNRFIHFRSTGTNRNTSIYFVGEFRGACGPYAVLVNDDDNGIIKIEKDLVLIRCEHDYLDSSEIEISIKEYLKLELYVIGVDTVGNVYINPNSQDPPILLRLMPNSKPSDINEFKHYKGNWYIRK